MVHLKSCAQARRCIINYCIYGDVPFSVWVAFGIWASFLMASAQGPWPVPSSFAFLHIDVHALQPAGNHTSPTRFSAKSHKELCCLMFQLAFPKGVGSLQWKTTPLFIRNCLPTGVTVIKFLDLLSKCSQTLQLILRMQLA